MWSVTAPKAGTLLCLGPLTCVSHNLVSKGETPEQTRCYFGPSAGFVLVFFLLFLGAHSRCWGILVLTSSLRRGGLTQTEIAD